MRISDHIGPLRRLLARVRSTTGQASAFAGRGTRALHYLWPLLVWSRISAERAGLLTDPVGGQQRPTVA